MLKLLTIFILPLFALYVSTESNVEVSVQVHIGSTPETTDQQGNPDQCVYSKTIDGSNVNVIVHVTGDEVASTQDKNIKASQEWTETTPAIDVDENGCRDEYEYVEVGSASGCYKFHTRGASWPDANDTCVREGTHLVVIGNRAEKDLVLELYRKYKRHIDADEKKQVSVGVYKDENRNMVTVDGQSIMDNYAYWGPDYKRNYEYLSNPELKYVFLYVDPYDSHLVNRNSFRRYPFVCEM